MDLREEIRDGYTVSADMKKVWAIQLKMAQYLIDVCKRHGLKVWADGGTLLGTVRHKGYIPWDDDIDMLMFREDYDKLIELADSEFKDPYFLQCAYTEKHYYRGHAQMRYKGTTAILKGDIYQPFDQSIFLDIFVYDAIPDVEDDVWKNKLEKADNIGWYLYDTEYYRLKLKDVKHPKRFLRYAKAKMKNECGYGLEKFKEYENLFREYKMKDCQRVACPCFNREIFKTATKQKEWYREMLYLPFEDIEMPVPIDYDKVLETQYGKNYMTPYKSDSMHGGFAILDAEKPYKYHLKRIREKKN